MLLPDRLDQRIAEAIKHQMNNEREEADTTSAVWRARCEVAQVAMYGDRERSVFISHISERRGSAAAREMQSQAETLRTVSGGVEALKDGGARLSETFNNKGAPLAPL